ncbi:MAG: hypothetical protein HY921_05135 [Elusimicrobia bacterium]|nr:hypothetical protein [Elusimicrobiota bacterium]
MKRVCFRLFLSLCACLLAASAGAQVRVLRVNQSGAVRIALAAQSFSAAALEKSGWLEPLKVYTRWAAGTARVYEERRFWASLDLRKASDRALLAPLAAELGRDQALKRNMLAALDSEGRDATTLEQAQALAHRMDRAKAAGSGLIRGTVRQAMRDVVYRNGQDEPRGDLRALEARLREVEAARDLVLKFGIYGGEIFAEEEGWISNKLGDLRNLRLAAILEPRLRSLAVGQAPEAVEIAGAKAVKTRGPAALAPSRAKPEPAAAQALEQFAREARRMSDALFRDLEIFQLMIHASKVGTIGPGELDHIKRGIKSEALPRMAESIARFKAASRRWYFETSRFKDFLGGKSRAIAAAALAAAQPEVRGILSLEEIEAVIGIDLLILDRPEIVSVDGGPLGGIEIELDVVAGVKRLGTMRGYEEKLESDIRSMGISSRVQFIRQVDVAALQETIIRQILAPALGWNNIRQFGHSRTDDDPKARLEFSVKRGVLFEAQALIPKIEAFLEPYAFKNYGRNILITARR